MENNSLPSTEEFNDGEDLKWFLQHAINSSKKGKYNKKAWDLLQLAIDVYRVRLITLENETKRA